MYPNLSGSGCGSSIGATPGYIYNPEARKQVAMVTTTELALEWLSQSDIRQVDGDPIARGGVKQGYNWQERAYPFIYSEITGYAISALVNAYRWTDDEDYVALARQSAGFLLRVQKLAEGEIVRGAVPHGLSLPGLALRPQYYSFDAAMCLQGLLDLIAVEPAQEIQQSARAIGDWLLERMQQDSGAFLSMYDAETDEWHQERDDVFGDGGSLHAKHAIGLLKLSEETGEDRYAAAAQRVCDWVLRLQDEDGAFRATEGMQQVVSHSHCYATEGLLFAHDMLGTHRYLDAARRAGDWLLGVQNRDGSINIAYKRRWWRMGRRIGEKLIPRRVTDATAQAARIWLILFYFDGDDQYLRAARRAVNYLLGMQCTYSPDRNAIGGFYFWPGHEMMYAWCTMFAVGALYALDNVDREWGYQCMLRELF
jgi:uncharacterized protein YyaL (SSP411 family)